MASGSPRRKELLIEAGYEFSVVPADIDESVFLSEDVKPCECAKRLALSKARSVAAKYPKALIIGADTVVDFKGRTIGKPADAEEAEEIITKLFSAPHKVITAVVIIRLSDGTEIVESDTTTVYPKRLSNEQIAEHIKGRSWQNKAGAYAIQENGDRFIERIDGSITNVMGLPMELLGRLLEKFIN